MLTIPSPSNQWYPPVGGKRGLGPLRANSPCMASGSTPTTSHSWKSSFSTGAYTPFKNRLSLSKAKTGQIDIICLVVSCVSQGPQVHIICHSVIIVSTIIMLLKTNNLDCMKLHTSRMEYPEGVPLERVTFDWHVIGNSINCCSIMKYLTVFF